MQEEIIKNKIYHRVYYYETDKMGRVYHSHFVNWMEEARTEYFRNRGVVYKKLEEEGLLLPIKDINVKYFNAVEYDENVMIVCWVEKITKVKIKFKYEYYNEDQSIKFAEGESVNVFTDKKGKILKIDDDLFLILKGGEK